MLNTRADKCDRQDQTTFMPRQKLPQMPEGIRAFIIPAMSIWAWSWVRKEIDLTIKDAILAPLADIIADFKTLSLET